MPDGNDNQSKSGLTFLRSVSLFAGLDDDALADLQGALEDHFCADGETIVSKGDNGDGIYLLYAGLATALLRVGNNDKVLATFKPLDFFGEMAMFEDAPRSADVRAVGQCHLLKLSRDNFLRLIEQHPKVLWNLCVVFTKRLRATSLLANPWS